MALSTKTIDSHIAKTKAGTLPPKVYGDGQNLWLQVTPTGASWLFRFTFAGVRRNIGLGAYPAVSLATARRMAAAQRELVAQGIDPVKHRDALQAQQKAATAMTFRTAAERFYDEHSAEWRSPKTAWHFNNLMATRAYPAIGKLAVAQIGMADALRVLKPIWITQNSSARRLGQWCRLIIDATRGEAGGIDADRRNPFEWQGNLAHRLAKPSKIAKVKHHAALDWQQMPGFMARLRQREGLGERMLELAILCAVRTGPILKMRWREVDLDAAVWSIPSLHEKTEEPLRVPLCRRAVDILMAQRPANAQPDHHVWPGMRGPNHSRASLSLWRATGRMEIDPGEASVHGFRSAFCDWRAEVTSFPVDLQEVALSHAIPGVRASYQRGDLFTKRRAMMQAWSDYCAGDHVGGNVVVPFKGLAAA